MNKIKEFINTVVGSDNKIKKILLGIALTGLSFSVWHNYIKFIEIEEVYGIAKQNEIPTLNYSRWFSAAYQQEIEEYVVLNNLLSPFFIRVNNQINFSLFDQINLRGRIMGKDNYLYQDAYVNTYQAKDVLPEDELRRFVEKMKFVQDTLKKLNKEFIYIQAPGKVSYYPEFLPASFSATEADLNNYKILSKLLVEYKVNHIDFRSLFLKLKSTTPYPFFTRTGIHWSKYAQGVAMDSINNFIEASAKIDIPELYWDEVELDYGKYEDVDLEYLMNLFFRVSDDKYGYPKFKYESHKNKDVPTVLMIGDSYLGCLYWENFYNSFDSTSQFWLYNGTVYSPSFPDKIHKFQLDQLQVLKNSDVVMLGCTEPNIQGTSWSFINDTYDHYKNGIARPQHRIDYLKRVDSCKSMIQDSNIKEIEKYAKKQKVSMDSAQVIYCLWKIYKTRTL